MSDKDNFTSRSSSLPRLRDEYDDDDDHEIVIFEEEDDDDNGLPSYDEYDYYFEHDNKTYNNQELPSGYTRSELAQRVTFVRSAKDDSTGDFIRQEKELIWCLQNHAEEAQPGVWSGAWYFTYLFGEKEGRRAWSEAQKRRMVQECGGKAMTVDPNVFGDMLQEKLKGNRAFSRGQYKTALDCYLKAEYILGGEGSGMFLVPHQRDELVKILSNQAEVYLRMKKYEKAMAQATAALQLDKRHQKSMLRRAKAVVYGAEHLASLDAMVEAMTAEDLQFIIATKSQGAAEAQSLMDQIDAKVKSR